MLGKRIKLFKLLGFEVGIDLSWIIIVILVAWSLSTGFFPFRYKNLSTQTYLLMGIVGAVGLFASIIAHELTHSLVARKYGLPIKGITLFIFGGVAEMSEEPPSARAEFMIAIVGPLSSIAIGLFFYGIYLFGIQSDWPKPINGVIGYLGAINGILAGFNLVPAFPLDGGRVLRSILWGIKGNLRWATRISSQIGIGFGFLLIFYGFMQIIYGNFIGGMWIFLIGMFMQGAARMSYQQLLTRRALEGEKVKRFMNPEPVTVSPDVTIERFVEDYIYRFHFKLFPVVDGDKLAGCVTTRQVKEVDRNDWSRKKVGDVMAKCSPENAVGPEMDAIKALSTMRRSGISRLMVIEGGRLVGVVTLKDMLEFLSLKIELDE
jgi:Zn-dependent protease/CBS domain-containing protein